MVPKEVFVNYHNFNLIWVQHLSIHVKKYWYSSKKKVFAKVSSYKISSEPKLDPELERSAIRICGSVEPESKQKEIISIQQHGYLVTYYFYQAS
jgi:hypothetical protein